MNDEEQRKRAKEYGFRKPRRPSRWTLPAILGVSLLMVFLTRPLWNWEKNRELNKLRQERTTLTAKLECGNKIEFNKTISKYNKYKRELSLGKYDFMGHMGARGLDLDIKIAKILYSNPQSFGECGKAIRMATRSTKSMGYIFFRD